MKKFAGALLIIAILIGAGFLSYKYAPDDIKQSAQVLLIDQLANFSDKLETTTSPNLTDLLVYVNSNKESNIPFIAITPKNEGIVPIVEDNDLVSIYIHSESNDTAQIVLGENNLPQRVSYKGFTFRLSNYTANTVDVKISRPYGTVTDIEAAEAIRQAATNQPLSQKLFIPIATAQPKPSFYNETSIAVNLLACGEWFNKIILAEDIPALNTFLTCGTLSDEYTKLQQKLDPCKIDLLTCTQRAFIHVVSNKQGVIIEGNIIDNKTESPVSNATIFVQSDASNFSEQGDSTGTALLRSLKEGTYALSTSAPGYKTREMTLTITKNELKLVDAVTSIPLLNNTIKLTSTNSPFIQFSIELSALSVFDGEWAASGKDITNKRGCSGNEFDFLIDGSRLTGEGVYTRGPIFKLKGSINREEGTILIGSSSEDNSISLRGQLTIQGTGSGEWNSIEGCEGTFTATKSTRE